MLSIEIKILIKGLIVENGYGDKK